MTARAAILARIGNALDPAADWQQRQAGRPDAVSSRLQQHPGSTRPGLTGDLTEMLITRMEAAETSVVKLQTLADVPQAVAEYQREHGIDGETTVAPALGALDWPADWRLDAASGIEITSITPCLVAVAETGSVVVVSGAGTPATLNFLPENHLVVLHESQIVAHMEDVWPQLRAMDPMPRATTMVTGPSRTADIEQTLEIGAHGPRRVHVMLVAGEP